MLDINIKMAFVAWWGAIVATLVLIWDIYKWKTSGPQIRFIVTPNTIVVGDPDREGEKYISAEATNTGDRPTTITNLVLQYYETYLNMLRHKPSQSMIVTNPNSSQALPYVLHPGSVWRGLALQTPDVSALAKNGYLVCGLCHSHSNKEIVKRIEIKEKETA